MPTYTNQAISILKDKGFRITKPRRLVVELLDAAYQALSAYEIKAKINDSGNPVDTVSVYRILDCLEENGLVHRILSTGKVKKCQLDHEDHCHLHQEDHCHHLLICSGCGLVKEIHCPGVHELIQTIEKNARFTIQHHNLEFSGICAQCSER